VGEQIHDTWFGEADGGGEIGIDESFKDEVVASWPVEKGCDGKTGKLPMNGGVPNGELMGILWGEKGEGVAM
jgi:hypothetical protein